MKYIIGGIFGILLCIALNSLNGYTAQNMRYAIPPCATEDSDNCYWDADTMGNGTGHDSVVLVQLPTK